MSKLLDVNQLIMTRQGVPYKEFKTDGYGRILTDEGTYKHQNQLTKDDEPVLEEKKIGFIINFALDQRDEKATAKELRDRFTLSCRIEQAMQDNVKLPLEKEDLARIDTCADLIKINNMFIARIHEATDNAEKVELKAVTKE